jgi:hypothetical protein
MGRKEDNQNDTFNDAHGNWCGAGWSAGQQKDAKDLTLEDMQVPAVDALDEECKQHDWWLRMFPEDAETANKIFAENCYNIAVKSSESYWLKVQAAFFGKLVQTFGPKPTIYFDQDGTSFFNLQRNDDSKV